MKQRDRPQRSLVAVHGFTTARPPAGPKETATLFQVSPIPTSRDEILALAMHFARRFATTTGKQVPDFSEDAARFLASRRWTLGDLTFRVCRAVEENKGTLISAADLGEGWTHPAAASGPAEPD
jgi:DNA-binding NtrC family response regulator